jgi:hypothetical protein
VPWSSLTVAGSTCFECGAREGGSSVEKAPESSTERRFTVQRSTDAGEGECNKQQHSRVVVSGKERRNKRLARPGDMGYTSGLLTDCEKKKGNSLRGKRPTGPGLNSFYDFLLFC